jgi:hypothetical protein
MAADARWTSPATGDELPPPQPVLEQPPAYVLPPPPNFTAAGPMNTVLLDPPWAAPPGFYCNVESSVVWPRFHSELQGGQVTLAQTSGVAQNSSIGLPPGAGMPITGDLVNFPYNKLNPTVTPRFEIGYRIPEGWGEVRLGYRFMNSSGSDTVVVGPFGPAAQNGRLNVSFVDLDYVTREFSLLWRWEMRWAVGVRYATDFLNSQVHFLNPVAVQDQPFGLAPFTRLTQYESVNSNWIGVHAVLEIGRKLGASGATLFGRVEGSGLYGRTRQTFDETFVESPGFTTLSNANRLGGPIVAVQTGLAYDIPNWKHSRVLIGYQYEAWWQFGRGNNDVSFGTLDDMGLFLRAEFNF